MVKRTLECFPEDFMFQLDPGEAEALRSRFGIKQTRPRRAPLCPVRLYRADRGGLSTVLKSPRAIEVNIEIMCAFVRLRMILSSNKDLARRLNELEAKMDATFRGVFEAILELMTSPEPKKRPIGFFTPKEK